jgi:hypothetical protein
MDGNVDRLSRPVGYHLAQHTSTRMAHDAVAREHCRHLAHARTPDRTCHIDARVKHAQLEASQPAIDGVTADARCKQLPARNDTVLSRCQLLNDTLDHRFVLASILGRQLSRLVGLRTLRGVPVFR